MNRKTNWQGMNWIRQEKRLAIYLRDGCACAWCGVSIEDEGTTLSLDHIKCHIKGGSNDASNLVTACSNCNTSRGAKSVAAFARVMSKKSGTPVDGIKSHLTSCTSRDLKPHLIAAKKMMSRRGTAFECLNGVCK